MLKTLQRNSFWAMECVLNLQWVLPEVTRQLSMGKKSKSQKMSNVTVCQVLVRNYIMATARKYIYIMICVSIGRYQYSNEITFVLLLSSPKFNIKFNYAETLQFKF